MRPDAIPVRPSSSRAVLSPPLVAALFGGGYTLRGTERVGVVRLGQEVLYVAVEGGPAALRLDALDRDRLGALQDLRLQGPAGAATAPPAGPVVSRLTLPAALRRAWNVGDTATVALGTLAAAVPVGEGDLALHADRALWLAAGQPEVGRWLPSFALAPPAAETPDDGVVQIERRVVTETDVRQARLKRQTILVVPGQVVTPAARSMGQEWGVFATEKAGR